MDKESIKPVEILESNLLNWIEAFLFDRQSTGLSKNTIEFYRRALTHFLRYCSNFHIDKVESIESDTIREYLINLENNHYSPGGIHAKYRALRSFFNWYENEMEDPEYKNPIRKIHLKMPHQEPLDPADINAVKALLDDCKKSVLYHADWVGLRDRTIILMLLDTGLRASELLSLKPSNVNDITGMVFLEHGKGEKSRTVYMSRKTRQAYRKYIQASHPTNVIFINEKGESLTRYGLSQMLERRSVRAGVPKQTPHAFRRLFALTMLRNGVDLYSLQALMGHADLQILKRYLKLTQQDTMQAHLKGSPVDKLLSH